MNEKDILKDILKENITEDLKTGDRSSRYTGIIGPVIYEDDSRIKLIIEIYEDDEVITFHKTIDVKSLDSFDYCYRLKKLFKHLLKLSNDLIDEGLFHRDLYNLYFHLNEFRGTWIDIYKKDGIIYLTESEEIEVWQELRACTAIDYYVNGDYEE